MLPSNRHLYYLKGLSQLIFPRQKSRRAKLQRAWVAMSDDKKQKINWRANYYNCLQSDFELDKSIKPYCELRLKDHRSRYYLDMLDIFTLFPKDIRVGYLFGDITEVPNTPTILKSRPIKINQEENQNSVLMPLNRLRHFKVVKDHVPFLQKKNACVWRGVARQPHRIEFLEKNHNLKNLNAGCTDEHSKDKPYHKGFMSIQEQLEYKYILSIEGYDVATSLKWTMHSNSLCFMRKPRFETWYMEGTLKAGKHYVELKDDYSDLTEKMDYYNQNPQEAQAIVANAQAYFSSFLNPVVEDITAYKVIQSYLLKSGQLQKTPMF